MEAFAIVESYFNSSDFSSITDLDEKSRLFTLYSQAAIKGF